jgi:hypothetical protein
MNERQNTDNTVLSADRRNRLVVENGEYAAFCRRILAAHARRIADGDIDGLAALVTLASDVDQAITDAVIGIRAAGYSWTDVANRLGITRQAARQRWTGKLAV